MKSVFNNKILSTKEFIDKLVELELLILNSEETAEMGFDAVYEENHTLYDLYYDVSAPVDSRRVSRIIQNGYDWSVRYFEEDIDDYVTESFDVENLTIKKTIRFIDEIWLSSKLNQE